MGAILAAGRELRAARHCDRVATGMLTSSLSRALGAFLLGDIEHSWIRNGHPDLFSCTVDAEGVRSVRFEGSHKESRNHG